MKEEQTLKRKSGKSGFPVSRPLLGLHPWNGTSLSKHMLWMSLALGTRLDFFFLCLKQTEASILVS